MGRGNENISVLINYCKVVVVKAFMFYLCFFLYIFLSPPTFSLTQQEQFKAQQGTGTGVSPMITNSSNNKEVDILRMLTKAKDEYTKVRLAAYKKRTFLLGDTMMPTCSHFTF